MKTFVLIVLLAMTASVGFAGIPIDITGSGFMAEGPETMKIHHISLPGDVSGTTYWATFQWNENTFAWEIATAGVDSSSRVRLSDTGQTDSFTATFGEDSDYTGNVPSFQDNGDGTATDNVTGLIWQKEGSDALLTWQEALDYCAALDLAGHADWWLPGPWEAMGLIDFGRLNPAVDRSIFSDSGGDYWLSTDNPNDGTVAWTVWFFASGGMDARSQEKTTAYDARCVRGDPLVYGEFTDNGDGTITDGQTRLMWEQAGANDQDWESALAYCEGLILGEHTDWRVPNIKELWSLFDFTVAREPIDTRFFPHFQTASFLSATTRTFADDRAWGLSGSTGFYSSIAKTVGRSSVRCVRDVGPE